MAIGIANSPRLRLVSTNERIRFARTSTDLHTEPTYLNIWAIHSFLHVHTNETVFLHKHTLSTFGGDATHVHAYTARAHETQRFAAMSAQSIANALDMLASPRADRDHKYMALSDLHSELGAFSSGEWRKMNSWEVWVEFCLFTDRGEGEEEGKVERKRLESVSELRGVSSVFF